MIRRPILPNIIRANRPEINHLVTGGKRIMIKLTYDYLYLFRPFCPILF
jgi:hypothetical protein